MRFLSLVITIYCSLALCSVAAVAQSQSNRQAQQPATKGDLSLIRQAAENFVRQAAEEAASLDDPRSAVRIQGMAAEALWNHDKEYARKLFTVLSMPPSIITGKEVTVSA